MRGLGLNIPGPAFVSLPAPEHGTLLRASGAGFLWGAGVVGSALNGGVMPANHLERELFRRGIWLQSELSRQLSGRCGSG